MQTMSSCYVEEQESENSSDVDLLPLDLSIAKCNRIDMEDKLESEMLKDRKCNKDPDSGEEEVTESEDKTNMESPEKRIHSRRNVKRKVVKPCTEETVAKKRGRKKSLPKAIVESKSPKLARGKNKSPVKSKIPMEAVDESAEPEVNGKRNRKRKAFDDFVIDMKKMDGSLRLERKRAKTSPEKDAGMPKPKDEAKKKVPVKNLKVAKTNNAEESNGIRAESSKSKPKIAEKVDSGDSSNLPAGWTRKFVRRKSGRTAGMFDVYIYSPEGTRFRSQSDVAAYLRRKGLEINVEQFSFKRGKKYLASIKVSSNDRTRTPRAKKAESASSKKKTTSLNTVKTRKAPKVKIQTSRKRADKIKKGKKKSNMRVSPVVDGKPSSSGL